MKFQFSPILPDLAAPKAEKLKAFEELMAKPEIGFFRLPTRLDLVEQTKSAYQKFSHKKVFVHVGIGGSSLGPEMIVSALGNKLKDIRFLNNIDPDYIFKQLKDLDPKDAVFFIVSKSGATAETLASFALLCDWLAQHEVGEDRFKEFFIFATDPVKGELRELAKKYSIMALEIPPNIGGRFSVLTAVGMLPALFAGIKIEELLGGASEMAKDISDKKEKHSLWTLAEHLFFQFKNNQINETVIMPYSSSLKDFSAWFVQLWAESLGKKHNLEGKTVNTGLTPIAAYGATDQHSQMQLFMHGPLNKFLFLIEIAAFENDYSLKSSFESPLFKKLAPFTLSELLKAELYGTLKALEKEKRPYAHFTLQKLSENQLGGLILFFEALTALMGQYLEVDPFDQPGVEDGKRFAFEWLERQV